MKTLAVLGGSSPFTAALIEALAQADLAPMVLSLHGRNQRALAAVATHARVRLHGWDIVATTDMAQSLVDATIVVHQIRYGGMALRDAAETFCAVHSIFPDETLGPAAAITGLRIASELTETVAAIDQHCPNALVINLTNPLSSVTAWMARRVENVIGLCELPRHTLEQAAASLGVPVARIAFSYTGFNHRGFFNLLRLGEHDLLTELAKPGAKPVGAIDGDIVWQLGALPLKYFALFTKPYRRPEPRAAYLTMLSETLLTQLEETPGRCPPSLRDRATPWYADAVVPLLEALASDEPRRCFVNLQRDDGLVIETCATVSQRGIVAEPSAAAPSPAIAAWLARFEVHERAFLQMVESPSLETLAATMAADPLVPSDRSTEIAAAIWQQFAPPEVC